MGITSVNCLAFLIHTKAIEGGEHIVSFFSLLKETSPYQEHALFFKEEMQPNLVFSGLGLSGICPPRRKFRCVFSVQCCHRAKGLLNVLYVMMSSPRCHNTNDIICILKLPKWRFESADLGRMVDNTNAINQLK